MNKLIFFDLDGTLVKKTVAEEAANRRAKNLGFAFDQSELLELMKTDSHYKINKEIIEKYTGVMDDNLKTVIMTNLFQLHYLGVVNERGDDIFYENVISTLDELKQQGYEFVIITTLREDIIKPALKVLGYSRLFKEVYGNTPDLIYDKTSLAQLAKTEIGQPDIVMGDKETDIEAGISINTKTILAAWNSDHVEGSKANFKIKQFSDIKTILKLLEETE